MQHLTMQHLIRYGFPTALAMLGLAACADVPTPTDLSVPTVPTASVSASENGKHIVVFTGDDAPADFEARVSARGGSVDEILTGAGLAIVSGLTAESAADLASTPGVSAVAADRIIGPDQSDESSVADAAELVAAEAPTDALATSSTLSRPLPDKAKYYARQWNLREAIKADVAWHAGYVGSSDVNVFILDTGVDYLVPDLVGRVDLNRSVSFVPASSDEYARAAAKGRYAFTDFHSHGTAVAALIASNADSLAGVTQKSTLVSVKVLDRFRTGLVTTFLRGISYAANHGADLVHLSLAYPGFAKHDSTGLVSAINRAINYAHRQGAVVVAAAGNNSVDIDHNQDNWRFCDAPHVICVSATGPTSAGGVNGPWANVDNVAPYTNFGRSVISVAGPGGNNAPNLKVWLTCSREGLVRIGNPKPCAEGKRLWESFGTTFGAAVTSGLAALLVSRMGHGRPDQIRAVIEQSADDLGQAGTDPYYGKGRINVARAMAMLK